MSTHERSEMEWTTIDTSSLVLYAAHVPTKCSQYNLVTDKKGKLRMRTKVRPRKEKTREINVLLIFQPIRKVVLSKKRLRNIELWCADHKARKYWEGKCRYYVLCDCKCCDTRNSNQIKFTKSASIGNNIYIHVSPV